MKKTNLLLASVCAAATGLIPFSPAFADAPVGASGDIGLGYSNYSANGSSLNGYGGSGAVAFGLGANFGAQVNGSYESLSGNNNSNGSDWSVAGSLFWSPANWGRLGATVGYQQFTTGGDNIDITNYGGFVEWYAGPAVTVAAKVGGASVSASGCGGEGGGCGAFGGNSGWYAGGGLTGYLMPDLAITGSVDYVDFSHGNETSYGVGIEWLVSESTPISIGGGYSNISTSVTGESGTPSISEWLVNVKFYFNGDNSMSLRDRQRNGASGWAVQAPRFLGE